MLTRERGEEITPQMSIDAKVQERERERGEREGGREGERERERERERKKALSTADEDIGGCVCGANQSWQRNCTVKYAHIEHCSNKTAALQ